MNRNVYATSGRRTNGDDDDASVSSNDSDITPLHLDGSSEIPGLRGMNGTLVMNVNTINANAAAGGGASGAGGGGGAQRSNNIQLYTNRLEAQFLPQHPPQQQPQQQHQDFNSYMMNLEQQQQQQQTLPSLQNSGAFNNNGAMLLQHQAAMLNSSYQPLQVLSYQHGGGNSNPSSEL